MNAGQAQFLAEHSAELELLGELRLWGWERLLFIDCGDGWIAEEAWRRIAKGCVCGVDRSPRRVARAVRLRGVAGKLEFKRWDGLHLPYPDVWFDSVVSRCDMGAGADPLRVLSEIRRVTRPGGEVCLVGGIPEWQQLLLRAGFELSGTPHPPVDKSVLRLLRAYSSEKVH